MEKLENSLSLPNMPSFWRFRLIWSATRRFTDTTYSAFSNSLGHMTLSWLSYETSYFEQNGSDKRQCNLFYAPCWHLSLIRNAFLFIAMEICTTRAGLFEDSFEESHAHHAQSHALPRIRWRMWQTASYAPKRTSLDITHMRKEESTDPEGFHFEKQIAFVKLLLTMQSELGYNVCSSKPRQNLRTLFKSYKQWRYAPD